MISVFFKTNITTRKAARIIPYIKIITVILYHTAEYSLLHHIETARNGFILECLLVVNFSIIGKRN